MSTIDFNSYRATTGFNKRIRFLVLHYTALDFAGSITALTRGQVSAHYLLPATADPSYRAAGFSSQRIFNLVDEQDRAWHAGLSHWAGRDNLNDTAIGIEIVNQPTETPSGLHFVDFEPGQIDALRELAGNILMRYPDISPKNVLGHADIAYLRKSDPGPKFPWQTLAQSGIGAWYEAERKQAFIDQFTRQGLPSRSETIAAFKQYGYAAPADDAGFKALVRAFQMHFRPSGYSGEMDIETGAILFALNARYR
ncbi:MAG: N-acetylmuramoyl-L-alanine amidase [Paludibacterium sp.]|uniref:N-acetylmuramoyl-L-alanine amidase n=1 Tax=Paludibacterium sp. TaxID=1917523 RepID=UPI0025FCDD54|nr:N-acetylmuramoyl-L-alanine amidase [Paludibacterium sp.]MBV8048345.1 N-acetylmuramoyl-L-alanine amidase [Paludibacterium sp.]MBV8649394.1 N-acetylmuramoyl-L-alanine amidase [Paludibacterium sp.]